MIRGVPGVIRCSVHAPSAICSSVAPGPHVSVLLDPGAEGTKIFDFDNPRSLEKALSGTELHQKLLLLTKKY